MARRLRVVAVGAPHHVTQRGNNRRPVFLNDADRVFFLETLRRKCGEHGVSLLGYCLLTNHYHLVAVPRQEQSLARALGQTNHQHALRFNRLRGRSGHLWQDRFFSCPLGPDRLLTALAYVDLNPVRARISERADDYPWSSARAHFRHDDPAGLVDLWTWSDLDPDRDWRERLDLGRLGRDAVRRLRRAVHSGLPFGEASFVDQLERRLDRSLQPKKRGPRPTEPRRSRAASA